MFNPELTSAVMDFSKLFAALPDAELERPWHWRGHDEGIRFAFFVVSRELRELAVRLDAIQPRAQPVRHILAQYHSAYLDLQAVLYGITHDDANLIPAEKDWPVRRVLAHILGAEIGFSAVIRYALEGHRAGSWQPGPMSDADEIRLIGMSEAEYKALMQGPYEDLFRYHQSLHPRILSEYLTISAAELDLPAAFWEPEPFPIRYRLHRCEAHMRQHTIQVEKTLAAIDLAPNEAKQLIRMLFASLAEVDGYLIGAESAVTELCRGSVDVITTTASEIDHLLNGAAAASLQSQPS
jgi:hypothetical protein